MTAPNQPPTEPGCVAPRANQAAGISIGGRARDGREAPGATEGRNPTAPNAPSQTQIIENYFAEIRSDGYIVDGVDPRELAERLAVGRQQRPSPWDTWGGDGVGP